MNFVAFDLETTGTVPGVDRIVEIGAVKFIDQQPQAIYATLIDPERPIPPDASRVNGITDDMVKGKPKLESLFASFTEFCEDLPLVAHNAPFDAQFLAAEIKKMECESPQGLVVDTLPMARKVIPGLANYKLGTLVQHFDLPSSQFHRAEEDATYCGRVFIELCKKVGQPDIAQVIALTGRPEYRLPFFDQSFKQLTLM